MVNQQEVNDSLKTLGSMLFTKVLGREELPKYGMAVPVLKVNVTHKNKQRDYVFGNLSDSEDAVVKVSDRDEYFQLLSSLMKTLREQLQKKTLLKTTNESGNGDEAVPLIEK